MEPSRSNRRGKVTVMIVAIGAFLLFAFGAFVYYQIPTDRNVDDGPAAFDTESTEELISSERPSDAEEKKEATSKSEDSADQGWFERLFGFNKKSTQLSHTSGFKGAPQVLNVLTALTPSSGATFKLNTLELTLLSNHVPGSRLSNDRRMMSAPGEGTYIAQSNGSIAYTPEPDFIGQARGVGYLIQDTKGIVFSSTYKPTVLAPTVQQPQPETQPTICSDPASQGLRLLSVREYMPYSATVNQFSLEYGTKVSDSETAVVYSTDENNHLYKSTDTGQTWVHISPNEHSNVTAPVVSADGSKVYIYTYDEDYGAGEYMASYDQGNSWTSIPVPGEQSNILSLSEDGTSLIALYINWAESITMVYRSSDSGQTWQSVSLPSQIAYNPRSSLSPDANTIYATGNEEGTFKQLAYKSTNGGSSWVEITPELPVGYRLDGSGVTASRDGAKLALGAYNSTSGESTILVSSDAGATWINRNTDPTHYLSYAQLSLDGSAIVARGYDMDTYNDRLFVSRDFGTTWQEVPFISDGYEFINNKWVSEDGSTVGYSGSQAGITSAVGAAWTVFNDQLDPMFDKSRVDLDPSSPGQQLVIDRSVNDGWIVRYDPQTGMLSSEVTDSELFPMPQILTLPYTLTPLAGCTDPVPGKIILRWESIG